MEASRDTDFMYRAVISGWMGLSLTTVAILLITAVVYLVSPPAIAMNWREYATSLVMAAASSGLAFLVSKKYKAFV